MRIDGFRIDRRTRMLEFDTPRGRFGYPFGKMEPEPTPTDPIVKSFIDEDLGGEAVTYLVRSGGEGTVHVEQAFDYNSEPRYVRDALLYRLTLEARTALVDSRLAKREVVRRLGTSASQLYRLLDQTNCDKTIDSMLSLLTVLGCDVELTVRQRSA